MKEKKMSAEDMVSAVGRFWLSSSLQDSNERVVDVEKCKAGESFLCAGGIKSRFIVSEVSKVEGGYAFKICSMVLSEVTFFLSHQPRLHGRESLS